MKLTRKMRKTRRANKKPQARKVRVAVDVPPGHSHFAGVLQFFADYDQEVQYKDYRQRPLVFTLVGKPGRVAKEDMAAHLLKEGYNAWSITPAGHPILPNPNGRPRLQSRFVL